MMQVQNEDYFLKEGLLDRDRIANVERVKLTLPFSYFASKKGKRSACGVQALGVLQQVFQRRVICGWNNGVGNLTRL